MIYSLTEQYIMHKRMKNKSFSARLKQLRIAQDMTLEELANAVDSTKSYIWEMEAGKTVRPSASTIFALARALDTSPQYLFEGDKSEQGELVLLNLYRNLSPAKRVTVINLIKAL